MKKLLRGLLAAGLAAALGCGMFASAADTDYIIDSKGDQLATPLAYQVSGVLRYLGAEGGTLKEPQDIFIDGEDNIYIADSGNNRIVKLDKNLQFVAAYTDEGRLNNPQGVFVDDYGHLFIADTGNQRIVHTDASGAYIEEFVRPETDMIDESSDFAVRKIFLSDQGYLYMIKGQQFMMIDAYNEFKGYVGANEVGFDLMRTLIRLFASEEMKRRIATVDPPPYNNFVIADDGMIYAVAATDSAQIRKINSAGKNLYPEDYIAETIYDTDGFTTSPNYVDIAVNAEGIVSVLEQKGGKVYQYDQEGNMLTAFGGIGNKQGKFVLPVGLAQNSAGQVFVLDQSTGYIHVFTPTQFFTEVEAAVSLYAAGDYDAAYEKWQEVAAIDVNYPLANRGLALSLYKLGDLEGAMTYFELAKDRAGYSTAFDDYRYEVLREHFFLVVLIAVVIIGGAIFLFFFLKKLARKVLDQYYYGGDKK